MDDFYAKEEYIEAAPFLYEFIKQEDIEVKREEVNVTPRVNFRPSYWVPVLAQAQPGYYSNQANGVQSHKNHRPKPFTIIRKPTRKSSSSSSSEELTVKREEDSSNNQDSVFKAGKVKESKISACKNYIGLVCSAFARTLLIAEKKSGILLFLEDLISKNKEKFATIQEFDNNEEFIEMFKQYIYKKMCGKKVKRADRLRDFKIRTTDELNNLLIVKKKDREHLCVKKEFIRELIKYFFDSDCYDNWLNAGMISEGNRAFLMKNKGEIYKKFLDPENYRVKFIH